MAKSLRSKVKRSFRHMKRENGVYAATAAARLNRLSSKLLAPAASTEDEEEKEKEKEKDEQALPETTAMELDADVTSEKPVSTHGARHSRREEWRTSKGMTARPERHSMNKQGGLAARRKAGRSHRRR